MSTLHGNMDRNTDEMQEKRRDQRINVNLPFLLSEAGGGRQWQCHTVDISPTGLLLATEQDELPTEGTVLSVAVQGRTEKGWEHINTRSVRVVRTGPHQTGLTYVDIE